MKTGKHTRKIPPKPLPLAEQLTAALADVEHFRTKNIEQRHEIRRLREIIHKQEARCVRLYETLHAVKLWWGAAKSTSTASAYKIKERLEHAIGLEYSARNQGQRGEK